jgi:hypothetical protein
VPRLGSPSGQGVLREATLAARSRRARVGTKAPIG